MKVRSVIFGVAINLSMVSCHKGDCEEREKKDCVVTYEYAPVCGCNGKTYDNPSAAKSLAKIPSSK